MSPAGLISVALQMHMKDAFLGGAEHGGLLSLRCQGRTTMNTLSLWRRGHHQCHVSVESILGLSTTVTRLSRLILRASFSFAAAQPLVTGVHLPQLRPLEAGVYEVLPPGPETVPSTSRNAPATATDAAGEAHSGCAKAHLLG